MILNKVRKDIKANLKALKTELERLEKVTETDDADWRNHADTYGYDDDDWDKEAWRKAMDITRNHMANSGMKSILSLAVSMMGNTLEYSEELEKRERQPLLPYYPTKYEHATDAHISGNPFPLAIMWACDSCGYVYNCFEVEGYICTTCDDRVCDTCYDEVILPSREQCMTCTIGKLQTGDLKDGELRGDNDAC